MSFLGIISYTTLLNYYIWIMELIPCHLCIPALSSHFTPQTAAYKYLLLLPWELCWTEDGFSPVWFCGSEVTDAANLSWVDISTMGRKVFDWTGGWYERECSPANANTESLHAANAWTPFPQYFTCSLVMRQGLPWFSGELACFHRWKTCKNEYMWQ